MLRICVECEHLDIGKAALYASVHCVAARTSASDQLDADIELIRNLLKLHVIRGLWLRLQRLVGCR
jgi:hypothetical protein